MRTNFLIILLTLNISIIFSQEKKTYLDSIFYDTINVFSKVLNLKVNEFKYTDTPSLVEKNFGKASYIDKSKDEDNKDIEYLVYYFGCVSFNDCKNYSKRNFGITFLRYKNNPFSILSIDIINIKYVLSINEAKFQIGDKIEKIKPLYPNSYNYYIKQREHNFRDRNEGIELMDYKNNKSVFFSVDEKTNTIRIISIDDMYE